MQIFILKSSWISLAQLPNLTIIDLFDYEEQKGHFKFHKVSKTLRRKTIGTRMKHLILCERREREGLLFKSKPCSVPTGHVYREMRYIF